MSACNVGNRTIFCDDNIDILPAINSDCVDLIYLDPPFNKNKKFTAPIGTSAEGASFKDIFREDDLKDEWLLTIEEDEPDLFHYLNGIKGIGQPYNFAYLAYMAVRLIECRRILKQDGSVYLHCDPTMSHYLKTTMDCIFGEKNFRDEIVWRRNESGAKGSQHSAKRWGNNVDHLLFYVKGSVSKFEPRIIRNLTETDIIRMFPKKDKNGQRYNTKMTAWRSPSMGARPNLCYEFHGHYPPYPSGWRLGPERMEEEYRKGNIVILEDKLERRSYAKDYMGVSPGNLWAETELLLGAQSEERTGYPTQKPLALLERIIMASSNEGDIVLDPFCGCATTCIAAEKLGRSWIGIDISIKAYELVQKRLAKETASLSEGDVVVDLKTDPPKRTDQDEDYREQKYVYVVSHPNYPGEYKVGIAKNWKSRLNSFQTSDPERQYKMEFKMETPWFRETERYIHDKFDNKHEWVAGNKDDIINEIRSYKPA